MNNIEYICLLDMKKCVKGQYVYCPHSDTWCKFCAIKETILNEDCAIKETTFNAFQKQETEDMDENK